MFEKFRIFGRQEDMELRMEGIPAFLDKKFENEKNYLEKKLLSTDQNLRKNFIILKDICIQLKSRSSPNKYANMLKDKFCEKAIDSVRQLPLPAADFDGMKRFMGSARTAVTEISEMGVKEFRHLHSFSDDMAKIAEKIRLIESDIASMEKSIAGSPLEKAESMKVVVAQVNEKKSKVDKLRMEISELDASLTAADAHIQELHRKAEIAASDLSAFATERLEIRDVEKNIDSIKQQVENEFSGLDRTMKKFVYFGELGKQESQILKEYINDPSTAFLLLDEKNLIRGILDLIYDYKDRAMIELDDKKLEKVKDLIRQFELLVELKKHYTELNSKRESLVILLDQKMEPIKEIQRSLNQQIAEKENELAKSRMMLGEKGSELSQYEKFVESARIKLEIEITSLLGSAVRIV